MVYPVLASGAVLGTTLGSGALAGAGCTGRTGTGGVGGAGLATGLTTGLARSARPPARSSYQSR